MPYLQLKLRILKLKEIPKVPESRCCVTLTTYLKNSLGLGLSPLEMRNLLPTKWSIALSTQPMRLSSQVILKVSDPHPSLKHRGSHTCGHRRVQHWFLPRVNLLPGKPVGPQGHAITTVAVVFIKGTATCRQKKKR